jgi:lipoate-protein ligase A
VAINELKTPPVSFAEAWEAFRKGFEKGLNISLKPYSLSDEQLAYVEKLAKEKYESDQWNFKR